MYIVCIIYRFTTLFSPTRSTSPRINTLSLHDALPILPASIHWLRLSGAQRRRSPVVPPDRATKPLEQGQPFHVCRQNQPAGPDRKSTRLNSSHVKISYAVFCLKKKTYSHNKSIDMAFN